MRRAPAIWLLRRMDAGVRSTSLGTSRWRMCIGRWGSMRTATGTSRGVRSNHGARTSRRSQRATCNRTEASRLQRRARRAAGLTEHAGEPHLSLAFRARLGARPVRYPSPATLFFDKDATQRTLIDVSTRGGQFTSILSPDSPRWNEPAAPSALDHVCDLRRPGPLARVDRLRPSRLSDVAPAARRAAGPATRMASEPARLRETASDLLRIITAFTVAHSITLGLATTGAVHVPVRPIEITIAPRSSSRGCSTCFRAPPGRASRSHSVSAWSMGLVSRTRWPSSARRGRASFPLSRGSTWSGAGPAVAGRSGAAPAAAGAELFVLFRALHARRLARAAMAGAAWLATRVGLSARP